MKQASKSAMHLWRWSLLACAVQVTLASAATNEFLDMSLEELVDYRLMSMSRKEQRVADMAAAAYVISAEEIRRSGAQSIPEALRLVPGLNVAQISRNRWAVSSRGFNERFSSKLLVQVDGRSVYSPMFSGVLWESQDAVMEDIERIEVIRGPGAALWGTNAMNGVINIVTRSAAASQGSMVSATVGSGQLASTSLVHGGILSQGGHFKLYGKVGSMGGSLERESGSMGVDGSHQKRMGVKLEPKLDGAKLTVKADVFQDRSHDYWGTPSVLAQSDPNTPFARNSLLSGLGEGAAVEARYAWKGAQGTDNVLQASVDKARSLHAGVWGSGTGAQKPLGAVPQSLVMGGEKTDLDLDFQQRRIRGVHDFIWGLNLRYTSDNLLLPTGPYLLLDGKSQRYTYSAFVHDEITWVPERFKLIWGSKFEQDGLTGFNLQPNVRALYTPGPNEAYWGALSRSARSSRRTESLATLDISAKDAHEDIPIIPAQMLTAVTQVSPLANAAVKAAVGVPVVANGDITSPEKALAVLRHTGADAIMIGRAAQGRPWIFGDIAHFLATGTHRAAPLTQQVKQWLLEHLGEHYGLYGEFAGVRTARKHIGWAVRALPGGEAFRTRMNALDSCEAQVQAVADYFDELSLDHDRLPAAAVDVAEDDDAQEAREAACTAN